MMFYRTNGELRTPFLLPIIVMMMPVLIVGMTALGIYKVCDYIFGRAMDLSLR